jgi:hypothetical protein
MPERGRIQARRGRSALSSPITEEGWIYSNQLAEKSFSAHDKNLQSAVMTKARAGV